MRRRRSSFVRGIGLALALALASAACGTLLDATDDEPARDAGGDGGAVTEGSVALEGGADGEAMGDAGSDGPPSKIVFVTTATHDGKFGGVAGADALCNDEATKAGMGGRSFVAFLVNPDGSPFARLRDSGAGWSRADGLPAFASAPPTQPSVPLDVTASRAHVDAGELAWVGQVNFNPTADVCMQWTTNAMASQAGIGDPKATNVTWRQNQNQARPCNQALHVYCFEE